MVYKKRGVCDFDKVCVFKREEQGYKLKNRLNLNSPMVLCLMLSILIADISRDAFCVGVAPYTCAVVRG
jgi:hypothetical protein